MSISLRIPVSFLFTLSKHAPAIFDTVRVGSRKRGDSVDAVLVEKVIGIAEADGSEMLDEHILGVLTSWRYHRAIGVVWCTALVDSAVRQGVWCVKNIMMNSVDTRDGNPADPKMTREAYEPGYITTIQFVDAHLGKEEERGPQITWLEADVFTEAMT